MVAAHDTDNIAQIPGIAVHPVQAAEQARLAAAAAQNAAANPEAPPPAPENVKDMSLATKQVLDKIATLLKDARRLAPSDQKPDHAEAVPAPAAVAAPSPSVASTVNAGGPQQPATAAAADPQASPHSLSTVSDSGAPAPH
jgi:hypothetical protein